MEKNYKFLKPALLALLGAAVGAGGVWLYFRDKIELAERFALVAECEDILKKADVEIPADDKISEKLAEGYAASFGDKYTFYTNSNADRDRLTAYFNSFPTAYGGGFELAFNENDELYFMTVKTGSYAEQHGIAEGDVVVSVNGLAVKDDDYPNMRELFGKDGTECRLVLRRGDENIELEYIRHNEKMPEGDNMSYKLYGDTLYIDMRSVGEVMITDFFSCDFDSVVLDLRDNGGGSTDSAITFADYFLSEGYVTEYYYTGKVNKMELKASDSDRHVPMVVLVNGHTASAAEIMTGLLKQFGGATVVGTNTFGKGIFQKEKQLSNGGYLRYTAGYFTVGGWECWHGKGIAPDVEIEMDSELIGTDEDIQLEKALALLD